MNSESGIGTVVQINFNDTSIVDVEKLREEISHMLLIDPNTITINVISMTEIDVTIKNNELANKFVEYFWRNCKTVTPPTSSVK